MQCHEFAERMHTLLDERRLPHSDARLMAHAHECPDCHLNLRAWEMLSQDMRSRSVQVPLSGFAQRVVSHLEVRPAGYGAATRFRFWFLAGAVATAAVALLALTMGQNALQPKPGLPVISASKGPPDDRGPATSSVVNKASDENPVNADGSAQTSNVSPVESNRTGVDALQQYSQAFQSLASHVPHAVERLDEVEEATPGLRPVRTSFSLAIGTIRRTIPPSRKSAPARKPSKGDNSGLWALGDQLV